MPIITMSTNATKVKDILPNLRSFQDCTKNFLIGF